MPFDQRSLIHREMWFQSGPRIPKNLIFLKNGQSVSNPSGSVISNMFCKAKSAKNKLFFVLRFQTIFKQKFSNLRPLLATTFSQGFRIVRILDIRLQEVGVKRRLNGTSKVNRQTHGHTDGHTDTQTDILTYRKHRPRGPML